MKKKKKLLLEDWNAIFGFCLFLGISFLAGGAEHTVSFRGGDFGTASNGIASIIGLILFGFSIIGLVIANINGFIKDCSQNNKV